MSATPAPNLQLRAAGLMLASTVAFGLMAICIRLASRTEPVAEIAFCEMRRAKGWVASMT